MSNSATHGLEFTRLFCPWDSPGKNTGVGCYFLLQRIFLAQGSNLGFLHCRQILYHLSHQTQVFLPGKSHGQRSLVGYSPWGCKELDTTVRLSTKGLPWWLSSKESACNAGNLGLIPGLEDPLEKGKATHSSVLAWRVPWTE